MQITWTPSKNAVNLKKHGISLQRAEGFDMTWAAIEIDDREDYGEVRYNALGFLDARLHSLTFTVRGENVHAISLRRATRQEETIYAESF